MQEIIRRYENSQISWKQISSKTSNTQKREIIKYCQNRIKKIDTYLLVRGIIIDISIPIIFIATLDLCVRLLSKIEAYLLIHCIALLIPIFLFLLMKTENRIKESYLNGFPCRQSRLKNKLLHLKGVLESDVHNCDNNNCRNCTYYYGQTYNNNLLVCAIHPYGQEDCPDYNKSNC